MCHIGQKCQVSTLGAALLFCLMLIALFARLGAEPQHPIPMYDHSHSSTAIITLSHVFSSQRTSPSGSAKRNALHYQMVPSPKLARLEHRPAIVERITLRLRLQCSRAFLPAPPAYLHTFRPGRFVGFAADCFRRSLRSTGRSAARSLGMLRRTPGWA
jgi:hypothetical protein